jgi:hypothetical protein
MSGLLERIARRRRASASRRLGPPVQNGTRPSTNGAAPWAVVPEAEAVVPEAPAPVSALPAEVAVSEGEEAVPGAAPQRAEPEQLEPAPEPSEPEQREPEQRQPEPSEPEQREPEQRQPEQREPESVAGDASASEPVAFGAEASPSSPNALPGSEAGTTTEGRAVRSEADAAPEAGPATFLNRSRIRRRARYLRRLREVQLRDIGGFMLELHRFGRQRPELVQAKLDGAAGTDRELRALERALGEPVTVRELREAGIGGACVNCGAVYGSGDRFCGWCGTDLRHHATDPDGGRE